MDKFSSDIIRRNFLMIFMNQILLQVMSKMGKK
jgi:hypothetical protein